MAAGSDEDDKSTVKWSELPKELWPLIGKRLNTTIDILRFRSTCSTWRSSTSLPLPPPTPSLSLFSPQTIIPHPNFSLVQTKLYRVQPLSSTTLDNSCSKGWIIMVGGSKFYPLRLLDPFTVCSLSRRSYSDKYFNLLDFKFIELAEAYFLNNQTHGGDDRRRLIIRRGMFRRVSEVHKVVLSPSGNLKPRLLYALYKDGKLRVSKIGDVDSSEVLDGDGNGSRFDDVIIHKGQIYVVDKWGTILWLDCCSMKLVQFSPMLCAFGTWKHLVVCGGSFYVVDMYIEGDPHNPMGGFWEVVGVKVYRLDEDWGRWLDMKDLGGFAFVLGRDSNFSLYAADYYGCEGNCVYFSSDGKPCAFSLETSKFKSPSVFWPCPSLFHPKLEL